MANYDNDPEMKSVMENFNRLTSQRFHQYDVSMQEKRQYFKEHCDKEIQKIILKDKIEKELTEKFSALQTKIDTNDIPNCVCEKSVADKVEKTCLKCGYDLGGVVPGLGFVCGIGVSQILEAAIASAAEIGLMAAKNEALKKLGEITFILPLIGYKFNEIVSSVSFSNPTHLVLAIQSALNEACTGINPSNGKSVFCSLTTGNNVVNIVQSTKTAAVAANTAGKTAQEFAIAKTTSPLAILSEPVVISFIIIVCIALILLVVYLILHYRRKNKMKKKLQYIKLLKNS
ncbi:PIR protein, putative [Plasmodium sp.]|nr:PIR protein, putative [Plasmodium sp.]